MIDLKDKVAMVTGGSRGIGAAASIALARAGASVVVNYAHREEAAAEVISQARAHGAKAIAVRADVARVDDVQRLFDIALAQFGRIDVLVANAGIWKRAEIERLDEKEWQETIDINLKGVYTCCRLAAIEMKKQGSGRIITVSSTAGQRGEAFYSHYAASKGGVISFTKALASELGPSGITVNSVAAGWVFTDLSAEALQDKQELEKIVAAIPLRRVATPEDIAGPILFLASDLARHITGEILNVNGGSVLCG
ncbi:MAG: 3-oxoacyl-ACP reductase FabG [Blastocatellia bacterium AA13]|nr:MAG: 3-oxoacyl-ACP reductase FabG [Blastocatellia bacterium AA13]